MIGGSTEYEGRVEICINNAWGTVYNSYSYYSSYFAQTVCNALGFSSPGMFVTAICTYLIFLHTIGATYYYTAQFGEGSGPILMYTYCYSIRDSLLDCYSWPQYIPSTSHEYDAGVRCESKGLPAFID